MRTTKSCYETITRHGVTRGYVALLLGIASVWVSVTVASAQTVTVQVRDDRMVPAKLQAVKGNKLSLKVVNQGSRTHNLVIPDFYIFTQNLSPGESVSVAFTPDKTGSFRYYSDTGGKPEPGISGTLRVTDSAGP